MNNNQNNSNNQNNQNNQSDQNLNQNPNLQPLRITYDVSKLMNMPPFPNDNIAGLFNFVLPRYKNNVETA